MIGEEDGMDRQSLRDAAVLSFSLWLILLAYLLGLR
jgi:hypothetical protein